MFTGGFEFVFILFIAFLLFGPKKLPEIARVLGKGLGELRRASNDLKFSLEEEIRNLDREPEIKRYSMAPSDSPAHTLPRREAVIDVESVKEEKLLNAGDPPAMNPAELTQAVTDNGHDHRDGSRPETGARS